MVDVITYRNTDVTRWGGGQNSDLSAQQIDINFWVLYNMILTLQNSGLGDEIAFFSVSGNQLFVTMMDHEVLGPYILPTANWNFRGQWAPSTAYKIFDVVTNNGSVYLVLFDHTSAGVFNPAANDGIGDQFYGLLITQPNNVLPDNGVVGQVLTVIDNGSPQGAPVTAWATPTRNLALSITGSPLANETLLNYVTPEQYTLPRNLVNSVAAQGVETQTVVSYPLFKNGAAIGSVNFSPSPTGASFTFTADVDFEPGDVLTLLGPPVPDGSQSNVSITLQALLQ